MKKITTIILSTACAFAVGSAFAEKMSLTVDNSQSTQPSTMKINNSVCTNAPWVPNGITPAGTVSSPFSADAITAVLLISGCSGSTGTCSAQIYADNACQTPISSGTIDLSTYSVSIDSVVDPSKFNVTVDASNTMHIVQAHASSR